MQVFNTFFHVIRKSLPSISIYMAVFILISIITAQSYTSVTSTDFTESDTNIAIIDRDGGSPMMEGLKAYLGQTNTLVDLPDDTERLQDELFYRNVEYIAIIPEGFTDSFEKNGTAEMETVVVPDSTSAQYVDILVNQYLNTYKLYLKYGDMTVDERIQAVADNLSVNTEVTMQKYEKASSSTQPFMIYFGYLAYILVAVLILGISTIMIVFNQPDLRRRNLCAPLKQSSMNLQLALGCVVFALICWMIIVTIGILLFNKELFNSGVMLYVCLNSLAFTIVCVALGFFVGIVIKSYNAQAAIANVLSLGMSFLCGVFVPQSIMSPTVLRIASFLPGYWYVKANDTLGELSSIDMNSLTPVFNAMLIQLGFSAVIFFAALYISKRKQQNGH